MEPGDKGGGGRPGRRRRRERHNAADVAVAGALMHEGHLRSTGVARSCQREAHSGEYGAWRMGNIDWTRFRAIR